MTERLQRFLCAIDAGIFGASLGISLLLTALSAPFLAAADIPWMVGGLQKGTTLRG